MNKIKFYLGAFLSVFCLESFVAALISIVLSVIVKIVTDTFIFWGLWGTLEAWCLIDAIYLTFTTKKDPWGKE